MKSLLRAPILAAAAAALTACSSMGTGEYGVSSYEPVRVKRYAVGDGSLSIAPPRPYNRMRSRIFYDVRDVEDWTLNGPYLDGISFVSGLKNNRDLIYQRRTENQQVPRFRSNMTPPEIAAMLESLYRVKGGTVEFRTLAIVPRQFAGYPGFQFDFEHLDSDELWRKGRAVGAVVNGELYLILVDAARSHYYNAIMPDFEAIVASARLRR
jgi:hypothetical protein